LAKNKCEIVAVFAFLLLFALHFPGEICSISAKIYLIFFISVREGILLGVGKNSPGKTNLP